MLTTDPKDQRLGHGVNTKPTPQHEVYLVLSEEERKKGFVRPFRNKYTHVGERLCLIIQKLLSPTVTMLANFYPKRTPDGKKQGPCSYRRVYRCMGLW